MYREYLFQKFMWPNQPVVKATEKVFVMLKIKRTRPAKNNVINLIS